MTEKNIKNRINVEELENVSGGSFWDDIMVGAAKLGVKIEEGVKSAGSSVAELSNKCWHKVMD